MLNIVTGQEKNPLKFLFSVRKGSIYKLCSLYSGRGTSVHPQGASGFSIAVLKSKATVN